MTYLLQQEYIVHSIIFAKFGIKQMSNFIYKALVHNHHIIDHIFMQGVSTYGHKKINAYMSLRYPT